MNDYDRSKAPILSPVSSIGSTSLSSYVLKSPQDDQHDDNEEKIGEQQNEVDMCDRYTQMESVNRQSEDVQAESIVQMHEEKANVILSCLDGNIYTLIRRKTFLGAIVDDEKPVDLWQLRDLALSNGGLVNSSIRKRAWLKLTDACDHILSASVYFPSGMSTSHQIPSHFISIPDEEIALIKGDIEQCRWCIESLIKRSRKIRKLQKRTGKHVVWAVKDTDTDSISNASHGSGLSSTGLITPHIIPESIRAFPRIGGRTNDGTTSPLPFGYRNDHEPMKSNTFSIAEDDTILSLEQPQSVIQHMISREERALLLNIVLSVLREIPPNSTTNINAAPPRLYYFQGMYNIAAVLLITLESPSLSSLAMKKLVQSHFREYCAPTFANIQSAIRVLFMPLLKEVDISFHNLLLRNGINDPCAFVLPWIICWYANDISDYDVICRIFDVFLAGHALLPIYLAVSFVVHPWAKSELLEIELEGQELNSFLTSIPSRMVSSQSSFLAIRCIEEVIEHGLISM